VRNVGDGWKPLHSSCRICEDRGPKETLIESAKGHRSGQLMEEMVLNTSE